MGDFLAVTESAVKADKKQVEYHNGSLLNHRNQRIDLRKVTFECCIQ